MPWTKASSAREAWARVNEASEAIFSTRSLLFTMPRVLSNAGYGVNHRRKTGPVEIAQFAILPYREQTMDPNTTVKLIAGILAVVLVAIIIMRRKKKKGATDDEF
jgi:hypothetical protein